MKDWVVKRVSERKTRGRCWVCGRQGEALLAELSKRRLRTGCRYHVKYLLQEEGKWMLVAKWMQNRWVFMRERGEEEIPLTHT